MVDLENSINDFLKAPDTYVLRLQGNTLKAEKRGILTWFRAHLLDPSTYRLPTIIKAIHDQGINNSSKIDLHNFGRQLKEKVNKYQQSIAEYNKKHPLHPKPLEDLLQITDRILSLGQGAASKDESTPPPPSVSSFQSEQAPSHSQQEQVAAPVEQVLEPIHPHRFPSHERLVRILRDKLFDIDIPQYPMTTEEKLTAEGLEIIAASNFKIAHATGDGNCLFTAIAIGLLVRMPMSEIVAKLREAIEQASIHAFGIHIDLKAECQELLQRLSTTDASSEIQNILTQTAIRNAWALLFRGLSLSRQLYWNITEDPPLSMSMQDHELNLEQEETPEYDYIQLMMICDPPMIWGSSVDVTALQESLGIRCPWISGQSSGKAKEVVILPQERGSKENFPLSLDQLRPDDIVLLFDPAAKHFDAAFFLPDPN